VTVEVVSLGQFQVFTRIVFLAPDIRSEGEDCGPAPFRNRVTVEVVSLGQFQVFTRIVFLAPDIRCEETV